MKINQSKLESKKFIEGFLRGIDYKRDKGMLGNRLLVRNIEAKEDGSYRKMVSDGANYLEIIDISGE